MRRTYDYVKRELAKTPHHIPCCVLARPANPSRPDHPFLFFVFFPRLDKLCQSVRFACLKFYFTSPHLLCDCHVKTHYPDHLAAHTPEIHYSPAVLRVTPRPLLERPCAQHSRIPWPTRCNIKHFFT